MPGTITKRMGGAFLWAGRGRTPLSHWLLCRISSDVGNPPLTRVRRTPAGMTRPRRAAQCCAEAFERFRYHCQPAVTSSAPTIEPIMPLGRSERPSPEIRLINKPPTKDPTSPATKASVQSIPLALFPRISCATAPTTMPNKMSPRMSTPGSIDERTAATSRSTATPTCWSAPVSREHAVPGGECG